MRTYIYMVRHAESPRTDPNERTRGLTDKGWIDSRKITEMLKDEGIDTFISSPYRRAILTIEEAAACYDKEIIIVEDLREMAFPQDDGSLTEKDLYSFISNMFQDPDLSLPGGESCRACTDRSVGELTGIMERHKGQKVVIGTHGMVMTLMMRYFDRKYDYQFLLETSKPDIYRMEFNEGVLLGVQRMWQ
ncbi:histidine phosphatase family protein [Paenibacillus sp. CF384]|uniref:histidine phosphatase family protein n=1 Tax=Paenibacillus sp. CF384 TaxID=1884382 RepID=UPI00089CA711|nr:histidine phosphatase family protein [Paenibacillus sp. CF384]SDW14547.1 2,3-bisphosphoglycerate-dependent phosphoglycerate mutase [Paenibacillus sp. CF384]